MSCYKTLIEENQALYHEIFELRAVLALCGHDPAPSLVHY